MISVLITTMGEDDIIHQEESSVSLPRAIASTHSLCETTQKVVSSNESIDEALTAYREGDYRKARMMFETHIDECLQAKYYLAVMYYDQLGGDANYEGAVELMNSIVNNQSAGSLRSCTLYNIARAYYEGFGVKQSDSEAEKYWLLSAKGIGAEDGNVNQGCAKSQSILGMFYARKGENTYSLKKSHYWHQEATGNGSIESQGTLGIMYEYGIYVEKDIESSFKCFKSATERGNVYAMGNLALHYYKNKMFTNACDVAKRVGCLDDVKLLSCQTDCLELYIRKGIALGCFVYARCIERGLVPLEEENDPTTNDPKYWYSRSATFDADIAQDMQDLVTHGKI